MRTLLFAEAHVQILTHMETLPGYHEEGRWNQTDCSRIRLEATGGECRMLPRQGSRYTALLATRQLGFGIPGGAEAVVQSVRVYMENMRDRKSVV